MKGNALRKLALQLLDEPNGIPATAYDILEDALVEDGHIDITEQVDTLNGRSFFANEDYAETELAKIELEQ